MLSLFGSAFTNVSESQMRLSRFLRKNLTAGELNGQLGAFYQKEIMKEMFKIAGAINLFGNPYVFLKYLAEGTWEIVNQPSEGFIRGPVEGAIGIGRGGVYFLRNVIAASFNSFEAVSESCSRGLATITFDQKFITRRDKIQMQKSKHILQGTKSALWAFFTGFEVAISGIVRHPREESRKSGTAGFFKGVALGLAGLVTKPMSGIFEAVSKFSEGVKQTALFFQDGPNTTRSRPPRVFISSQEYYSEYSL
jgi:vacuolar protein sorting-associated protein 13A/C